MRIPSKYPGDLSALKKDPDTMRKLLQNPETRSLLHALQNKDREQLQSAARSALQGDIRALSSLLDDLKHSPETSQAIDHLNQN